MSDSNILEVSWSSNAPLTVGAYRDFLAYLELAPHVIVRATSVDQTAYFSLKTGPLSDSVRAEWDQRSFAQGYRIEWYTQTMPATAFSRDGYRITGLTPEIRADHLKKLLEPFNADSIVSLHSEPHREFVLTRIQVLAQTIDETGIRERLLKIRETENGHEWNLLPTGWIPEDLRMAAFDLDSTLIEQEGLDELAREYGCYEPVSQVTEAAMRGELDFAASFTRRVAYLKGLERQAVKTVFERIELTPGAEDFFAFLSRNGIQSAIFSGGFDFFAEPIAARLGISWVVCNRLEWKNDQVTGMPLFPIVDAARKAQALIELREKLSLIAGDTLAVGDGANDIPMLLEAGAGVAFHAKPKVKQAARLALDRRDLRLLIPLLGFVPD